MLAGAAAALYPNLLVASTSPSRNITIYNAAAGRYAMSAGLLWWTFGMLLAVLLGFALLAALGRLAPPLWESCLAIFVVAWIGQFIGHALEGRRPSFFKDLQFLLIGPLWITMVWAKRSA